MTALNNTVRSQLMTLIKEELDMVNEKAEKMADAHWKQAETDVANELGYGPTLDRIAFLKNQIEGLQTELNILEGSILERARAATVENYKDVGVTVNADRYGEVYRKPVVFGKIIGTLWDVRVLQNINETLPFIQIYEGLAQLHHVVRRELLLCGNFQEARVLYQNFHGKVMQAIGQQMPGLLAEVRSIPALQRPADDQEGGGL